MRTRPCEPTSDMGSMTEVYTRFLCSQNDCCTFPTAPMSQRATTPSEAAPEMGLTTAGKPTTSAALDTSADDLIRWLAGVGKPARFMHDLVFCAEHNMILANLRECCE